MLDQLRQEIDRIDDGIKDLFTERMNCVEKIAAYKGAEGISVYDGGREREIIARLTAGCGDELGEYIKTLFNVVFDISKAKQNSGKNIKSEICAKIKASAENTPKTFPQSASVACQGAEGSYSQIACEKLFSRPSIMYSKHFDGVFGAVEKGLCKYGILPIENSLHGSVTEVYDLMKKYDFHIARSIRLKVDHALLCKSGAVLGDIKEIWSHEQGLAQCGGFIGKLPDVKTVAWENTASAAKDLSAAERTDVAVIASPVCAEIYGLSVLERDIQNNANNYTRFICISKELEIYPGSDKISLMFTLPHKPGSLYGIIAKFAAMGINLTKIESRPIPERDFEFMFYADIEAEITDSLLSLMCGLETSGLELLGIYS